MKNLFLYTFLFLLISQSAFSWSGSVTVSLDQPPPFQFRVENMWKVTLNNTGAEVRVYLTGSVMKGNSQIIDATTSAFNLARGMKRVSAAEMSPIDLKKYNNDIEQTLSKAGTSESGTYTICIKVKDREIMKNWEVFVMIMK
ncbi:MAG: hypothetical protein IPP52_16275 [Ignavibacteria bacterium]|nr:hypothetical protein [Ignavibacteria bacterium]